MSVVPRRRARALARSLRARGRTIVFTNGCFDLVHRGHVTYLAKARALGDVLIVGLNGDASVRRLKGAGRPVVPQTDRAAVLDALKVVDYVVVFTEDTPERLIGEILPDVLVKGGDWPVEAIAGAAIVRAHGGRVTTIALVRGRSSTALIRKLKAL